MSDSVQPHRRQPTRPCHPWDSPGENTGVGCHFLLQCMKVKSESEVTQSCPTPSGHSHGLPWTAAYQVPLSMGFSRQEYQSGVPLPSPQRFDLLSLNFYITKDSPFYLPVFKLHIPVFFFFFISCGNLVNISSSTIDEKVEGS